MLGPRHSRLASASHGLTISSLTLGPVTPVWPSLPQRLCVSRSHHLLSHARSRHSRLAVSAAETLRLTVSPSPLSRSVPSLPSGRLCVSRSHHLLSHARSRLAVSASASHGLTISTLSLSRCAADLLSLATN
ncbi:hypothetical protein Sjap_019123 [Stephania japonica]|uniref:Uncharacterized protein n=1 Tax=Stephania japonica TaxID=461633 RepID=A0AAP0EYV3_9MAGN